MKCERCGKIYPSKDYFHHEGNDSELICTSCGVSLTELGQRKTDEQPQDAAEHYNESTNHGRHLISDSPRDFKLAWANRTGIVVGVLFAVLELISFRRDLQQGLEPRGIFVFVLYITGYIVGFVIGWLAAFVSWLKHRRHCPLPVTIIACLGIGYGLLSVFGSAVAYREAVNRSLAELPYVSVLQRDARSPTSIVAPYLNTSLWWIGDSIVATVISVALFLGNNWARWLYIASAPIRILISLLFIPETFGFTGAIIGFGFWSLIAYFLTRPDANAFFAAHSAKAEISGRV